MSGAFAIFVKTPGLSPVKTRLAADIGKEKAEAFHLASARAVAAETRRASARLGASIFFAVAEPEGLASPHWRTLGKVYQGSGGLGERLRRIYAQLVAGYGYAVLLGADSPQLSAGDLEEAGRYLADGSGPRFAFGPAADGGFWLFGGNRNLPDTLWTSVEYSTGETGGLFKAAVAAHGPILTLPVLDDVDDAEGLKRLQTSPIFTALSLEPPC